MVKYLPTAKQWGTGILYFLLYTFMCSGISFPIALSTGPLLYAILIPLVLRLCDNAYHKDLRTKIISGCLAFLFSQFILIGHSFEQVQSYALCFGDWQHLCKWSVLTVGFTFVVYKIDVGIINWLLNLQCNSHEKSINLKTWLLVIIAVRLLYFIAFFPCSFDFDGVVGLRTSLDPDSLACNHHPFFVQLVHAGAFLLGCSLNHACLGFAILTLVWIGISSAILYYSLQTMTKAGLNRNWTIVAACIFAFFPLFPYLSVFPTKDGFFSYWFLLYLSSSYNIYITEAKCLHRIEFLTVHCISIFMMCLTRHQGSIIVILEMLALVVCYKNEYKRILCVSLLTLLVATSFLKSLLYIYNVEPSGKQEILGTFFQQSAYYLIQHPDDVSVQEIASINKVLNADTIKAKYNPIITDPVKRGYKYNPRNPDISLPVNYLHIDRTGESEDIKEYLSAWWSMFCKHPSTYVEATTAVFIPFFYDFGNPLIRINPAWSENKHSAIGKYNFWHVNKVADIYKNNIDKLLHLPVLGLLFSIPLYNWIAFLLFAILLIRKDYKGGLIFFSLFLSLALLFICPVAYGRYVFPIAVSLPMLLTHVLTNKHHNICQE